MSETGHPHRPRWLIPAPITALLTGVLLSLLAGVLVHQLLQRAHDMSAKRQANAAARELQLIANETVARLTTAAALVETDTDRQALARIATESGLDQALIPSLTLGTSVLTTPGRSILTLPSAAGELQAHIDHRQLLSQLGPQPKLQLKLHDTPATTADDPATPMRPQPIDLGQQQLQLHITATDNRLSGILAAALTALTGLLLSLGGFALSRHLSSNNKLLQQEISQRRAHEEHLEFRINFENMLSGLSASFISMDGQDIDLALERALNSIGQFCNVDSCHLLSLEPDQSTFCCSNAWARGDEQAATEQLLNLLAYDLPYFVSRLSDQHCALLAEGEQLPDREGTTQDLASLHAAGLSSLLGVPLLTNGRLSGLLMLVSHTQPQTWDEEYIVLLRLAAEVFSNVLQRGKSHAAYREAESQITHLTYNDSLTGLPNRNMFYARLERLLELSCDAGHSVAVVALNIDRFQYLQQSLGAASTDSIVQEVARRIAHWVQQPDMLARIDGDNFACAFGREHGALVGVEAEVTSQVQRIVDSLSVPFHISSHELQLAVSFGITVCHDGRSSVDEMLKQADIARRHAATLGKNQLSWYSPELAGASQASLTMEAELRHALDDDSLCLVYQPQVHSDTGELVGVEALIRWQHPIRGWVPPSDFIPLAEESGLILPIGQRVLEMACTQAALWQRNGFPNLRLSVNLSSLQFRQANLITDIEKILSDTGFPPHQLELEITESSLLVDTEHTIALLTKLRDTGMLLAIDDFGTGYSSLAYLKRFPLNRLKIDQSFVRDINNDPSDAAIVTATITLAHSLNLMAIAEGVETKAQMEFLRDRGCDEVQGYLLARPMLPDEFIMWVQGREAAVAKRA